MGPGDRRGRQYLPKAPRLIQKPRKTQHKADLHKLRELKGEAADRQTHPRAIACDADPEDEEQEKDSDPRKIKAVFRKVPDLIDEIGDEKGEKGGRDGDHILFQRFVEIQPLQHDEAIAEEETDIIEEKLIHIPVDAPEEKAVDQEKGKLRKIKEKEHRVLCL